MTSVPSTLSSTGPRALRRQVGATATGLVAVAAVGLLVVSTGTAQAATRVDLGTADGFAVLAGAGITNTGVTTITGDIGTFPTPSITGAEAGIVQTGTNHAADAVSQGAKTDLVTAYDAAAGQLPETALVADPVGLTLTAGVYTAPSLSLTGRLRLDAAGDPDAVFVFKSGSDLTTGSASRVELLNGAQACNVYWQVTSSATLGTGTAFRGNILALSSITLTTGATVEGRVLARNGAVTLDTNTITRPGCSPPATPSATPTPTPTATPSSTPAPSSPAPVSAEAVAPTPTTPAPEARRATYGQVRRVPVGPVDTGDGSTS